MEASLDAVVEMPMNRSQRKHRTCEKAMTATRTLITRKLLYTSIPTNRRTNRRAGKRIPAGREHCSQLCPAHAS